MHPPANRKRSLRESATARSGYGSRSPARRSGRARSRGRLDSDGGRRRGNQSPCATKLRQLRKLQPVAKPNGRVFHGEVPHPTAPGPLRRTQPRDSRPAEGRLAVNCFLHGRPTSNPELCTGDRWRVLIAEKAASLDEHLEYAGVGSAGEWKCSEQERSSG
jgi:hypothetical protein